MIGQITPLVQEARKRAWVAAAVAHVVGSALSALLLGLALGAIGALIGLGSWGAAGGLVAAVFLACALKEVYMLPVRLPSFRRQTPKWFPREFGPVWGAFAWGVDLGQGWTTRIESFGYYGIVVWAVLLGVPTSGAAVLGAFGLSRALPVVAAGAVGDTGRARNFYRDHAGSIRLANAVALSLLAGCAMAGAVGVQPG